jgi:hypothetical protein
VHTKVSLSRRILQSEDSGHIAQLWSSLCAVVTPVVQVLVLWL